MHYFVFLKENARWKAYLVDGSTLHVGWGRTREEAINDAARGIR